MLTCLSSLTTTMKVSYRSLGRLTVPAALDAEEEALEGDPVTRGALQAQLLTCAPAGDDVLLGGGCSTHTATSSLVARETDFPITQ